MIKSSTKSFFSNFAFAHLFLIYLQAIIVGSPSNGHSQIVTSPKLISGGPSIGPASPLSTLMGSSPVLGSSLTPRSAAISIPQIRSNNNSPQASLSVNANDGEGFSEIAKGSSSVCAKLESTIDYLVAVL